MPTDTARRYDTRRILLVACFEVSGIRLEELREYGERSERWLTQESADIRAQVAAQHVLTDPYDEQAQHYIDAMAEDVAQIEETFPQIFRASLFIQCCADFEHMLVKLARRHEWNLATKFAKVDGSSILDRARTYLEEFAGVKFPDEPELWEDIVLLFQLRNVAVHANRTLIVAPKERRHRQNKAAIRRAMKRWPKDVTIDRFSRFGFSPAFVPHVLKIFERFMHGLRGCVLACAKEVDEKTEDEGPIDGSR